MTTLRGAVKDSGAFDVTFKEGEQDDYNALDLQGGKRSVSKISNKKYHQGTQTKFVSFLAVADLSVHEPIEDTCTSLWV